MDDNSNEEILEKFKALRGLKLNDPGLLVARDLHPIIIAQMDLTISLFEKQHKDIKKLSKSSSRLEVLTCALIGLTACLIGITIWEKFFLVWK